MLRPGYRPACLVAEDRRMRLALRGVNTLQAVRSVTRIGVKPRTLAAGTAGAADWQSLAARRLALFIVNSIESGTRWVITVAARMRMSPRSLAAQVRSFFEQLYEAGAFAARRMEEAFFVVMRPAHPRTGQRRHSNEFRFLIGFAAARRHGISRLPNFALGVGQQSAARESQPFDPCRVLPGGTRVGGQIG